MARTTAVKVKAVLLENYDTDTAPSLTAFIDIATVMTDRLVTCAAADSQTLTVSELLQIETLLAAHYYQHADQGFKRKQTGDASGEFHGKTDEGLRSTQYGQSAMNLDWTGCLRKISKGVTKGKAVWLGKARSAETEYKDRD